MAIDTEIQLSNEELGEFCAFYKADYKALVGLLIKSGASLGDAQDAAQEAMLAALRKWPEIEQPKSYAWTVAIRALYRTWGNAKREKLVQPAARDESAAPFDAGEEAGQVLEMLKSLPEAQRLVFALYFDGYEPAEISRLTGQHPDTVRSNLRHARAKLAPKLGFESIKKEVNPWTMTTRQRRTSNSINS